MIKINIEDADGQQHKIDARSMLGGALTAEPTPGLKPVTLLIFGEQTESDKMSLISAQLSILTADLAARGLPAEKIAELFMRMTLDSIDQTFKQPEKLRQYREERSKQ